MKFDCDRTCPLYERVDSCRFNKVFNKIGPVVVNSHTVKVKCDFRDHDILAGAVRGMGGEVLGKGTHNLYSSNKATGFGFTLPNWKFPLVAEEGGQLAFDNYGGSWGNPADLERLKTEYVIATAEQAAMAQGWMTERNGETLTIHHPSGGSLTVTANGAEANGFMGSGCHDALMSLNLPMSEFVAKPEFGQTACEIQQGVG